jgi:hypothetical protein
LRKGFLGDFLEAFFDVFLEVFFAICSPLSTSRFFLIKYHS